MWVYLDAKFEVNDLAAQQNTLTAERDRLQVELASYQTLAQGPLKESVAFVERVSYPVTPLIDETIRLLPNNTYLRAYEFSEQDVRVEIDFEMLNVVSSYVALLERSDYFQDVRVEAIHNFEVNPANEENKSINQFSTIPRYHVELLMTIDRGYLAALGGGH